MDAEAFLDNRNKSYQKGCGTFFLTLTALAAIFVPFDLQYSRKAYPDKIVSSGGYFNVLNDVEYRLEDIDTVQLNCSFYKGKPRAYYRLYSESVEIMELEITTRNLKGLSKLNEVLRKKPTKFLPHTKQKKGEIVRVFFGDKCVNAIARKIPDQEVAIRDLLKLKLS